MGKQELPALPDQIRVPLHKLWADAGYLVGRARAGDADLALHRIKALCDEVERAALAALTAQAAEVARLTAEVEGLRKDAERYHWLRSRVPGGTYRIIGVIYSDGGAGVDAAIDTAMKEQTNG